MLHSILSINGFTPPLTLDVLQYVDANVIQDEKNAGIMEIGIHHGQFFILLNQFAHGNSYAIDLFEEQQFNIDNSGHGNLACFKQNLQDFDEKHRGSNVTIISEDSLYLINQDFTNNKFRYISVDGGHTPVHVQNDLTIAATYIAKGGIVILDDYLNHWWPSVTEGIAKYLTFGSPSLVPFCSSPNKLWLCNMSYHLLYYERMKHITLNKSLVKLWNYDMVNIW